MSTFEVKVFLEVPKNPNIDTSKDVKDIEDLIILENPCYYLFIFLIVPPAFFVMLFLFPIKILIRFDRINNQLLYLSKGLFGCNNCCETKTLDIPQIKSCRLYQYLMPNRRRPLERKIYMACDIESVLGYKFTFFSIMLSDQKIFEELGEKLKNCVDTEIVPLEVTKS